MEGHTQFVLFLKCTIRQCYLICEFIHMNIREELITLLRNVL